MLIFKQQHLVAPPENWEEMNDFSFPMLFYGVKGQQMREGESPSYFNAGNSYLHITSGYLVVDDLVPIWPLMTCPFLFLAP